MAVAESRSPNWTSHYVFLKKPTKAQLLDLAEWLEDGAKEAKSEVGEVLVSWVEP